VAIELVLVGELLSAPLAALGCWVHPGGAVLGGTAETTGAHSRRAARTDVRACLSPVVRDLAARARKVRSAQLSPWKYQADS